MVNINDIFLSLKFFGISPVIQGLFHKMLKKMGYMKLKFPAHQWEDMDLSQSFFAKSSLDNLKNEIEENNPFCFQRIKDNKQIFDTLGIDQKTVVKKADEILNDKFTFFSIKKFQIKNINWHQNPFNQAIWPEDVHWSEMNYFSKYHEDIKSVWELARFGFAYDLVRAYILTNDSRYAEKFWQLFEKWYNQNPPNLGVHWVSGQECAIRLFAWCFALFAILDNDSSSPERLSKILKAIFAHGQRIEGFISHAIRQKTNHSITEAAGLYTIGLLFPFLKNSPKWLKQGKEIIEKEVLRQVYGDGSYVQQSMNYHRLMLQAVTWVLAITECSANVFSKDFIDRLNKSVNFLYQMQDPNSGCMPNYGSNDGALILPLNSCDYLDYRPAIQAVYFAINKKLIYDNGNHLEDLVWLFGFELSEMTEKEKIERKSMDFDIGGYYTLRADNSWAMIRCHSYVDRVSQADMMHFDFWANGENLIKDCGSYRYFAPSEPEMESYFKSVYAHNTIIVDNQSPIKKVSRFVFLPWPKAETICFDSLEKQFKGRNLAYARNPWNVIHTRDIKYNDDWTVTDILNSSQKHEYQLRWHLHSNAKIIEIRDRKIIVDLSNKWFLQVYSNNFFTISILEGKSNGGWESLYYSKKCPLKTLVAISNRIQSTFFETRIIYKG